MVTIITIITSIIASLANIPMTLESGITFKIGNWSPAEATRILMENSPFYISMTSNGGIELTNSKGQWLTRTSPIIEAKTFGNGYCYFVTESGHKYQFTHYDTAIGTKYLKVVYRDTQCYDYLPNWYHGKYEEEESYGIKFYTIHPISSYFVKAEDASFINNSDEDFIKSYYITVDHDTLSKLNEYKKKVEDSNEFDFSYRKRVRNEAHNILNPSNNRDKKDFIRWYLASN